MFGISEIALLLVVVIVVLGAKRLPDLVRSAGRATRILKGERRAMKDMDTPGPQEAPGQPRTLRARPGDWTEKPRDPAA
ncbi:twin-arginine translocase TatA/TatE family subunit [Streptomyces sp. NPDC007088]|uniref:twin-arginine translocase TatA/TatE family subunit n=1 Tax=Streptomyces sp. NPDC007088 TaxID=3364773 RepID=UPI00367B3A78